MDQRVMELRIKQWISLIEEQAKSGMKKGEWCALHGIDRTTFFRWQKRIREYLLDKCEGQPPQLPPPAAGETGFVEISAAPVALVEAEDRTGQYTGDRAACGSPSSISIRYGDFSIDLCGSVDEGHLTTVLRAIKYAE